MVPNTTYQSRLNQTAVNNGEWDGQRRVNNISRKILKDIENYELSLTSIAKNFHYTSTIGCADLKKVSTSKKNCSQHRNHNIKLSKNYSLIAGL